MTAPVITSTKPQSIDMTAPVITGTGKSTMSFVLPEKYTDLSQIPIPNNPNIKIKSVP